MAKLHSLVASNAAAACRSSSRVRRSWCAAVSAWFDTGVILPSILNAGGNPRQEQVRAFRLTISFSISRITSMDRRRSWPWSSVQ